MSDRFVNSFTTAGSNASAGESVCACSANTALLLTSDTAAAVSVFVILGIIIVSVLALISEILIRHVIISVLVSVMVSVIIIRLISKRPKKAKAY